MTIIDNEKTTLLKELNVFLDQTERASIAVGYFFISGFAEIMDSLKRLEESDDPDHILRLLISPTTDRLTAEAMLEANESCRAARAESHRHIPETESADRAKREVKKTLEYMPQSEKDRNAVKKLIDLIRKGKVQIKVYTQDRLHAKAYILELDRSQIFRGAAIVGSSNLSISGIRDHAELNLLTSHEGDHRDLLKWFDRHWNHPSCREFTKDVEEILDMSWAGRQHEPSDVYGKAALYEHGEDIDIDVGPDHVGEYVELFDFQKKAVNEAIHKLDDYGGVIIADVVGMGKTYVGTKILQYLKENRRSKPLVICPPHLQEMWKRHLEKFEIYGEVESRYRIGMDDNILRKHTHCDAILIDESHNFRHHNTNAYRALLSFMEEKTDEAKVIMLTATPISNTINDLKNQLKLFPAEGLENIPVVGASKLDEYFKGLETPDRTVTPEGIEKIRNLLRHVLIRRVRGQIISRYAKPDGNRYYLEQSDGSRKYFPTRNLKNPAEYNADKVYNDSFDPIQDAIVNLNLARYAPGNYVREEFKPREKYKDLINTTAPILGIVRTVLLKRMESSIKAFATSVEHYQEGSKEFKRQLLRGRIPIGKDFQDLIYRKITDDGDYEEAMADITSKYDTEAFDIARWVSDIDHDIKEFASIRGYLGDGSEFAKHDDKLHKLLDLVKDRNEKILIFSESAVTARYVYDYLRENLPDRNISQIDSKQDQKTKTLFVQRFDPYHNSGGDMPREQQIDILISTDVLSEGVNLHAGRTVINYDFHWNPVRLIQRVGRVDRIGSEHPTIDIFNFLPTTKIDAQLSLRDRVAHKIQTIRSIIGTDQKILESTEDIDERGVSAIYNPEDDSVLDPKIRGILDVSETRAEKHANDIRNDGGRRGYYEELPFGIRGVAGSGRLLIACEAEDLLIRRGNKSTTTESSGPLRRYYEITPDGIKGISAPSFLQQVGKNSSGGGGGDTDSLYNKFVAIAWDRFDRDIRNEAAKNHKHKHQEYFERKLTDIATHSTTLVERARRLQPFVRSRMRPTHQPYRSLIDLHKKIDRDTGMGDEEVVAGLEHIWNRYGDLHYERHVRKPRILYSMMVNT